MLLFRIPPAPIHAVRPSFSEVVHALWRDLGLPATRGARFWRQYKQQYGPTEANLGRRSFAEVLRASSALFRSATAAPQWQP